MRLAFALAGCALLSACSEERPTAAGADVPGTSSPAVAAPAAQPAQTAPVQPRFADRGTALTADVRSISGQITDLFVEYTPTQIIVQLPSDVLFDFDSATIRPQAEPQLRQAVALIRQGAAGPVAVIGHTDALGDDAYNQTLSERRAASVVAWLSTTGGVGADRLRAEGRGEGEPVAPNARADGTDDPAARQRNRRVTLLIPRPTTVTLGADR